MELNYERTQVASEGSYYYHCLIQSFFWSLPPLNHVCVCVGVCTLFDGGWLKNAWTVYRD